MDALELPYGLTPDAARGSREPCPGCSKVGTLVLSAVLVAAPIGEFSLAGAQPKVSARVSIRATCAQCGWTGVGDVEEDDSGSYLVIRP